MQDVSSARLKGFKAPASVAADLCGMGSPYTTDESESTSKEKTS